jgi:PAS domain S-box-containing protein
MRDDSESKEKFRRLREQAERFLKGSGSGGVDADAEDFARLLHEIEVHEIELELQNDELQRARRELEAARDECAELFESSPVGYVTLGRNGLIQKANTAAHALLGFKDELTGRPFSSHLEKEDFPTYYEYLNSLVSKPTPSPIEVRVPRPEGVAHVRLEATAEGEKDGTLKRWRLSLVDVTERRRAEEKLRTSRETMLARTEGIARIGTLQRTR